MRKAAAREVAKNFGRFREMALVEPVTVQTHGRDSVVMLSVREYERLRKLDRMALAVQDLSEGEIKAIAKTDMDRRHAHLDDLMD